VDYKDEYSNWAHKYDKFGAITDINEKEEIFFRTIFDKYSIKRVLDCACGTGLHLYLLSKLGVDVCGSDYSRAMLKVCSENLLKAGVEVKIKQTDFRFLEDAWSDKFDAILCMTQSIAHLHTHGDLLTALKSMYERLNDGGILIMSGSYFNIQKQPSKNMTTAFS
jgi:glycine/sarcosine N-methyltransferase